MVIAVDFDGTIVEHKYPKIGREIPFSFDTLKQLHRDGHLLILWTVREGELLEEAVAYCLKRGVEFAAVNQDLGSTIGDKRILSRKLQADIFIDDRNVGGLPDWGLIYRMIRDKSSYGDLMLDSKPERGGCSIFKWLFASRR